jgi:hypothetical protein
MIEEMTRITSYWEQECLSHQFPTEHKNILIKFNSEAQKEIFSNWQLEMKVYMQLALIMRSRIIKFTT